MARKFENLTPITTFGNYADPFRDRTGSGPVRPESALEAKEVAFLRDYDSGKLYFSRLGHSSVFLAMSGKTMLIDPVFSKYASPFPFAGPKRFPGKVLLPAELPSIDYILITHSHYDHLDKQTIRSLDKQVGRYIVPLGVERILKKFGIAPGKVVSLNWYETFTDGDLRISCTPSQHGSARSLFDRNQSLWCSFVLKNSNYSVFDTGDGGFGEHFSRIHEMYGDMDLAIMECGQYNVRWHPVHMFPEESALAAARIGAKLAVPVHWGAYVLSDHPWDDPPKRFSRRAKELGVPCRIPELYEMLELTKER